jgi:hypothetical protein
MKPPLPSEDEQLQILEDSWSELIANFSNMQELLLYRPEMAHALMRQADSLIRESRAEAFPEVSRSDRLLAALRPMYRRARTAKAAPPHLSLVKKPVEREREG